MVSVQKLPARPIGSFVDAGAYGGRFRGAMRKLVGTRSSTVKWISIVPPLLVTAPAFASEADGHSDPVASVAMALVVILTAAKLGGDLAAQARQPAVLGELIFGVMLGNLTLAGVSSFEHVGLGMIPRGEVGLIFANVGLTLSLGGHRIIDQATFSAVIVMVIVTTMVNTDGAQVKP